MSRVLSGLAGKQLVVFCLAWLFFVLRGEGEGNVIDSSNAFSRRKGLAGLLAAGVSVTIAAMLYPVVRFLWPRPVTQSGTDSMVAPYRVGELRPDGEGRCPKPFNFGGKPCLLVLTPAGVQRLARGESVKPGDVRAFNAICTHTDCTVDYRADSGDIFCACHNGVYSLDGLNVSGPPPRPLETYKVAFRGEVSGQEEIIVSRT